MHRPLEGSGQSARHATNLHGASSLARSVLECKPRQGEPHVPGSQLSLCAMMYPSTQGTALLQAFLHHTAGWTAPQGKSD